MTTELVNKPEITWDKPQQILTDGDGLIVVNTGDHDGTSFEAFVLHDSRSIYPSCHTSRDWSKESFILITEPITITFKNH
jgi:hypothetical protein